MPLFQSIPGLNELTKSGKSSPTIHKYFVRPIVDYADVIYDKPFNECFKNKISQSIIMHI